MPSRSAACLQLAAAAAGGLCLGGLGAACALRIRGGGLARRTSNNNSMPAEERTDGLAGSGWPTDGPRPADAEHPLLESMKAELLASTQREGALAAQLADAKKREGESRVATAESTIMIMFAWIRSDRCHRKKREYI